MLPTEDERFTQNFTAIKPFKLLSVFRSPGILRFVALGFFSNTACFSITYSYTNCVAVCIDLHNQNHCHSDSKHASYQVPTEHFANHHKQSSKNDVLIAFLDMALISHAEE